MSRLQYDGQLLRPKRPPSGLLPEVKPLAQAYYLHHASCATCIAAGRGPRYDTRCDEGQQLWTDYDEASAGNVRQVDAEVAEGEAA